MIDRHLKKNIIVSVNDCKLNINIVEITLECSMTNLPRNGQMIDMEIVKNIVANLKEKIVNNVGNENERLDGFIGNFRYRNIINDKDLKEPIRIDVKDAIPTVEYFVHRLTEELKKITPFMVQLTKIVVEENTGNFTECVRC